LTLLAGEGSKWTALWKFWNSGPAAFRGFRGKKLILSAYTNIPAWAAIGLIVLGAIAGLGPEETASAQTSCRTTSYGNTECFDQNGRWLGTIRDDLLRGRKSFYPDKPARPDTSRQNPVPENRRFQGSPQAGGRRDFSKPGSGKFVCQKTARGQKVCSLKQGQ
jgi:hypothetical protein